jgi:chromosome partitioning protein
LLIDLDPQANATSALGLEKLSGGSVYKALLGSAQLADSIRPSGYENLEIIPSEVDLAVAEVDVARTENYLQRMRLALLPLHDANRYDFMLVDCPPSLGILTMNALAAVDRVLVPLQCEYFALEGLAVIMRVVQQIKDSGANPAVELEGIVMTMFDGRTNLSQQVVNEVRGHFGEKVFKTIIPRTVRLGEAPSFGKPITVYDTHSQAAAAYRALAGEVLALAVTESAAAPVEEAKAGTESPLPAAS